MRCAQWTRNDELKTEMSVLCFAGKWRCLDLTLVQLSTLKPVLVWVLYFLTPIKLPANPFFFSHAKYNATWFTLPPLCLREFSHPLRFIFVNKMRARARLTRQFLHGALFIGCSNECIQIIILSASELHIINCTRRRHAVVDRHLSLICMHSDMQNRSSMRCNHMGRICAHQTLQFSLMRWN